MPILRPFLLLVPAFGLLSGCQAVADAPSLAPRPAERQPILDPAPASEPDSTLDPALRQRLAAILSASEEANVTFERARSDAETAVGKAEGRPEGDDAWVTAQQALSGLEAARAPMQAQVTALAELRGNPDYAARANRDAIDVAESRVSLLDDAQSASLQALAQRLR
jgi:hypothetical protein